MPDEETGGRLAGEYLASLLAARSLSIVTDDQEPAQQARLKGLVSGLGHQLFHTYPYQEFNKDILDDSSAVLALSQQALHEVLTLRQEDGPSVYGFDAEESRLRLMEEGRLEGIVANDPYAMGYIAGSLLDDIHLGTFVPSLHLSPKHLVTAQTLYDTSHVKLMFPLLH